MFVLIINIDGVAVAKGINHIGKLFPFEIEITEEQYNSIKIPCTITIEDGKVAAWQETIIQYKSSTKEPSLEERISAIEKALLEVL